MEPSRGTTPLSELESGIAGLRLTEPVSNPPKLPPRAPSANKKRRLETTRGLGSPSRGASYFVTPANTPSKFYHSLDLPLYQHQRHSLNQAPPCMEVDSYLLINQPFSPGVIQQNYLLLQSVPQPSIGIRTSVISPRVTVEQASLDWDNYSDSPSYRPSSEQQGSDLNHLNLSSCIREIQGITGLEDIKKVTLVDTSESSLSTNSLSVPHHPEVQINYTMSSLQTEARVLENMTVCLQEMMEDFTADDVRRGNLEEVPKMLEEISKARTEFRSKVREYKQTYSLATSSIAWLDESVATVNQQVKAHAYSIWEKVEQVQPGPAPAPVPVQVQVPTAQAPSNHTRDDIEYKRKIYRDQLLYLTEALSLPDDDDSVEEYWKDKTESDVCSAMQELTGRRV